MLKVSDIMSRDVFTVDENEPLDEVAWTLDSELVSGAPVVNGEGNVVGMISKTDIVEADKPANMLRASDVMSKRVWCVGPYEPATAAVQLMAAKGVHRVLVVRGFGAPAGIVTAMDVVRAVADGRRLD